MADPTWLRWAQQMQSIAQAGLTYSNDPYDQERFHQLRQIVIEIMSQHTAASTETLASVLAAEKGYLTPKVDVRPAKMLAVLDRAKHEHPPLIWAVYKLFVRCEILSGSPRNSLETDGAGFFDRQEIPPLSVSRVTAAQIRRMFEHYDNQDLPTDFD